MAKLIVTTNGQAQEFELGALNTLGRHPDNTIQILDRIVSKEHAQIARRADGRYVFRDLGSLNGTFWGGKRVTEHVLENGDEMVMGTTQLSFVEMNAGDTSLHRVTIAPSMLESIVRHQFDVHSGDFLPEKQVQDVEQLRRDYEKLRTAHELGRAIVGILDLEELLPRILGKLFELLPADRGVILLYDAQAQLTPRYVKHRSPKSAKDEIILSKSILSEVEQQKKAVLSSDATMDSRFAGAHSVIMQGIRSTMCVPLLHGEELLGVMHLDSQIATNAFTEKDLQIFSVIAAQAAVAIQNARLAKNIENETKMRAQFQRLLSPNLVEELVKGTLDLDLEKGGELREVTILISDIRGFTAMSEQKPPAEVVQMLNEYFEVMVEVLFGAQGTLDKYVGDEIMALFGAPVDMPEAPVHAVKCAIDMQKALRDFNRTRTAENLEPIRIGIGINTGWVITGALGSSQTLQYTAIGDPVNTASRLCSIAKAGEIIVSENTMRLIEGAVEAVSLPPVRVKGKEQELKIFNVVGMRGDDWRQEFTKPQ